SHREARAILPTPTVAAVGLIADPADIVTSGFKREGAAVLLLGSAATAGARALGGSEWLGRKLRRLAGDVPLLELDAEARLQKLVLTLARARLLESAHDVSDGGLAVALAECCTTGRKLVGAKIALSPSGSPLDAVATLFGEAPSRVVVSVAPAAVPDVLARARSAAVPADCIGETTAGPAVLSIEAPPLGGFSVDVNEAESARQSCLSPIVGDSNARPAIGGP
ncbi:MAG TPA: AIR synthase-related protein, partial [Polyangiaceae bacterium]|nr:AIR synthase-related protein [Polyangiaceae bacterium]